eukprot:SAG31_NODE_11520_length_1021_cov_1.655098_2_plen_139_part_00
MQKRQHLCDYLVNQELAAAAREAGGMLPSEPCRMAEEESALGETHCAGGPAAALAELTARLASEVQDESTAEPQPEPQPEPQAEGRAESATKRSSSDGEADETPEAKLKLIQALLPEYAMVAEPRADYDERLARRAAR